LLDVVERRLEHSRVGRATRRETSELVKYGRRVARRGVPEHMVEKSPAASRRVARIRGRGVGVELSLLRVSGRRVRPDTLVVDLLDRRVRK
jgi:hypothetical protein